MVMLPALESSCVGWRWTGIVLACFCAGRASPVVQDWMLRYVRASAGLIQVCASRCKDTSDERCI